MRRTIKDVVEGVGFWGHGGEIEKVAAEWADEGFTPAEVEAWLEADVCWPEDAREYADKGWTPEDWKEHTDVWKWEQN